LSSVDVEVRHVSEPVRLVLATVNDEHLVPRSQQLVDQRTSDEPSSHEHERAHCRTILSVPEPADA